jgi:hypothetical protein
MLKSSRRFGVEIEFTIAGVHAQDKLHKLSKIIPLTSDGSLRDYAMQPSAGAEYVSPILSGAAGVREINNVCEVLKKHGATGEDPATSVHVHLDGQDTKRLVRSSVKNDNTRLAISRKLVTRMSTQDIERCLLGGPVRVSCEHSEFGNIKYLSLAPLTREPKLNYEYFHLEKPDRFHWLRNVLYFYTKFQPVMTSMVSRSRRFDGEKGNVYCVPLDLSFDTTEIASVRNMEELRLLWYRNNPTADHWDDSRYHAVNLHSFWNRHGTVEIRSHGGTVDPDKIIMWVRLHQKIVDKLETADLSALEVIGNGDLVSKCRDFVSFVSDDDDEVLGEYVKRLLGYFSNIKV